MEAPWSFLVNHGGTPMTAVEPLEPEDPDTEPLPPVTLKGDEPKKWL